MDRGLTARVERFAGLPEASAALAQRVVEASLEATARSGRFTLAVSGGKTPEGLFHLLGGPRRPEVPWGATHLFWVDERAVPPEDPRSNFGATVGPLLGAGQLPPDRVHRIRGELADPATAAGEYEGTLRRLLATPPAEPPATFDLVLLGIGPDGHTASLFPGSPALEVRDRWTAAVPAPAVDPRVPRVTLTLPAINAAREVAFLVSGADKADALASILSAPPGAAVGLPAGRVRPRERLTWFTDRLAAPRGPGSGPK